MELDPSLAQAYPVIEADPVTPSEFNSLLNAFAPFEPQPHLAVAVSGGSDSMALTLLAQEWAAARGGRITALTVDHGLRAASADEAVQVGLWCAKHGIAHAILRRDGPAFKSGIQAAARTARYGLLEAWCRAEGVLHLLSAHQRDDQAETVLMRWRRGSGIDGLAGMSGIVERGGLRLLRPLLTVSRARLRAGLTAGGQNWIDDPSNENPAFTRVRLRNEIAGEHPTAERLFGMAARFGRARAALEPEFARLAARSVALHPAGFAWVDHAALKAAPAEIGAKLLAATLTTVSGGDYPPRLERVERLFAELQGSGPTARTLGGCQVIPRSDRILICREPRAVAAPMPVAPGGRVFWDGRFQLDLDPVAPAGLWLGALGRDATAIRQEIGKKARDILPGAVWPSLAVLRDAKGVVAVPTLEYLKCWPKEPSSGASKLVFRPIRPLTSAGFRIV